MQNLALIVVFCALGGALSVSAASLFLLLPERRRQAVLPHGLSFATGALLAVAFWGLLPHAFAQLPADQFQSLSATLLVGIVGFFTLEKLLVWRHCHDRHCAAHARADGPARRHSAQARPVAMLVVIGDGIHNFVDGILIAAAFLTDTHLGLATSLAVATHEIPQEVGDFAILLANGCSRKQALLYNLLSSAATVAGGVLGYFCLDGLGGRLPYLLALAAASFIYIAVADLIPTLHQRTGPRHTLEQLALIAAGALLVCCAQDLAHGVAG